MFIRKNFSLCIILSVVFIDYLGIGLVYPLFASLLFDHEVRLLSPETSDTVRGLYLGILIALVPLAQFFSAPILGALSDQKGRKKILAGCLSLAVLGYSIAFIGIVFQSIIALMIYRLVVGISAGSAAVVQAILADTSSSEEKSKNFGLYNMALGAGFTIGPFIGGKLTDPSFIAQASFNTPFAFALILTALNLVFVLWFLKETNTVHENIKLCFFTGLINLKKAFILKGIRLLILCAFIVYFGWSFFYEFVPVYLIGQYAYKSSDIGNFYAYSGALYAICCGWLIRPVVKYFSASTIFFWSLIGSGISIFLFMVVDDPYFLFLYVPFIIYFVSLLFPTLMTIVSNWASLQSQGEILGVLQSVQAAAFAISPLFSGSLIGIYLIMPIIVGGVSMILAAIIFGGYLYKRRYREESDI